MLLTLEIGVGVVEQDHVDGAPVVLVHDAGAGVDGVLPGESGARGDTGICARGDRDGEVGLDHGLSPRGHHVIDGARGQSQGHARRFSRATIADAAPTCTHDHAAAFGLWVGTHLQRS